MTTASPAARGGTSRTGRTGSPRTPRRTAAARLEADVVVVGARCAGAATALLLARAGHDVLVVDRATFPSDTISTHVIARSGMVALHRWGVLDAVVASGAPPIRRVEFTSALGFLQREVKDRHGVDFLLAPRRIVLDGVLQRAARQAGARDPHRGRRHRRPARCAGTRGRPRGPGRGRSDRGPRATGRGRRRTGLACRPLPWGRRSRSSGPPPVRHSTRTTTVTGRPSSTTSAPTPSPASSRPMTGRPASGSARRSTWRARRGGNAETPVTPSTTCWRLPCPASPPGSTRRPAGRPCAGCCACPTTSVRHPAPGGHSSATPATTATPSPATASATPSATPSCSPRPSMPR